MGEREGVIGWFLLIAYLPAMGTIPSMTGTFGLVMLRYLSQGRNRRLEL